MPVTIDEEELSLPDEELGHNLLPALILKKIPTMKVRISMAGTTEAWNNLTFRLEKEFHLSRQHVASDSENHLDAEIKGEIEKWCKKGLMGALDRLWNTRKRKTSTKETAGCQLSKFSQAHKESAF